MNATAAIILAGGGSTRMGSPKAALPWRASAKKWRRTLPDPQPKSSTRLPSKDQSGPSSSRIVVRESRPTAR